MDPWLAFRVAVNAKRAASAELPSANANPGCLLHAQNSVDGIRAEEGLDHKMCIMCRGALL